MKALLRNEILYHKFPEIFRRIILEKYRYFSGKIPNSTLRATNQRSSLTAN